MNNERRKNLTEGNEANEGRKEFNAEAQSPQSKREEPKKI